jgi:hypothetical protein
MDAKWVYDVIEGRDQVVRRILSEKDPHVLATKHTNCDVVATIVYKRSEQHTPRIYAYGDEDRGFIEFFDEFHDRKIFVATKEVGKSQIFHEDCSIKAVWNVISPCSNHEHSTNMSNHTKQWFVTNILHVCMQMFDTEGDIALFCKAGRSRSPMYLIAYMVLFCDMTFDVAHHKIDRLMQQSRSQVLDRHYSLHAIIAIIIAAMSRN